MDFNLFHPRDQIISIMDRIYQREMTTVSGGNISILDAAGNIWITPKGLDKGNLKPRDIICVQANGIVDGMIAPSSELPSHQMIYEKRGDIKAIVHTHSPSLMAYSISDNILDTRIHPYVHKICGQIGFVPYALMGTTLLGENISKVFTDGFNCVLLENHSAFCGGRDLLEAFHRMESLDFCARILINANPMGNIHFLSTSQLEKYDNSEGLLSEFKVLDYTPEEYQLRKKIVTIIHRAYQRQLITSSEGVMSARLGPKQFLITPQGCDRTNIGIADIVLVENGKREQGKVPDSSVILHQEIYARQPQIQCVITAQPPHAMAFVITGVDLDTTSFPESYVILRHIQRVGFDTHMRSYEGTANILSTSTPVIMIENDYVVTTGRDPFQAFDRLEVLDFTARALLFASQLGRIKPLGDHELKELDRKSSED